MSKLRLENKVAIITGAASGIGEAAARLFAAHGAFVVVADIQDQLGIAVADSIGDRCTYKHCDVTDEKQVEHLVGYALEFFGRLDIVYSNAGVMGPATGVLDLDPEELDRVMAVNVRGTALMMKHGGKAMVRGGTRGAIVCTASITGHQGGVGPAAYTASKHALVGLVRAAAGELGPHGIRVNCVSPFGVATPLACSLAGGVAPEMLEARTCQLANLKGVVLKAGHVAEAALFLASDESAYVSGHDLFVDGGSSVVYAGMQQGTQ